MPTHSLSSIQYARWRDPWHTTMPHILDFNVYGLEARKLFDKGEILNLSPVRKTPSKPIIPPDWKLYGCNRG
jgi:hypothetical protein